jgi:methylenetetrahydrofolate dehydrogenase (NADP+)/methenyltetrahydrofolate cyclohydrolase
MIVDGKGIADRVYARTKERVTQLGRAPVLAIITCDPNFETRKYLSLKERKATSCGIKTTIVELPPTSDTQSFIAAVTDAAHSADGVIVQLPLPASVDTDAVIQAIPLHKDVDALNIGTTGMLSPVVGAIKEILEDSAVDPKDALVTIIGSGRLVGLPAYRWFQGRGAHVSIVTKDTLDISHHTRAADVVFCGAGVSGLLKPDMVREGVVILDAGTSEDGGVLRGDADPACAEKASVFTPVPGGIGPITIAILLSNVVDCAERSDAVV